MKQVKHIQGFPLECFSTKIIILLLKTVNNHLLFKIWSSSACHKVSFQTAWGKRGKTHLLKTPPVSCIFMINFNDCQGITSATTHMHSLFFLLPSASVFQELAFTKPAFQNSYQSSKCYCYNTWVIKQEVGGH